ncbi:MAG: hypothetical protein KatS3mg046_800 [Bellilinea sp.]|nr:MAG: hypothetical protein KatS3mg046_800 [Bellilinea sp.]
MEPIVVRLEVTIEDILYILESREKEIKDKDAYIGFLRKYLPRAMDAHLYDEVKYLTDSYLDKEQCPHRRTTTVTTGGYHYSAGQVWDDLKEVIICLDCGKQLPETDGGETEDAEAEEVLF